MPPAAGSPFPGSPSAICQTSSSTESGEHIGRDQLISMSPVSVSPGTNNIRDVSFVPLIPILSPMVAKEKPLFSLSPTEGMMSNTILHLQNAAAPARVRNLGKCDETTTWAGCPSQISTRTERRMVKGLYLVPDDPLQRPSCT